jgi:hypothetical protein
MKKKKEKTQSVLTIDERLQTENEHYNEYVQKIVTECIGKQIFTDEECALRLYSDSLDIVECADRPFDALKCVLEKLSELSGKQKYFILKSIADYISPYHTEYEKWNCQDIMHSVLMAHIKRMDNEFIQNRPKTADIRDTLKDLMQKEISELPQRLEKLDDEKRLGIVCKLMPYVFPKVETVEASRGENKQWYED